MIWIACTNVTMLQPVISMHHMHHAIVSPLLHVTPPPHHHCYHFTKKAMRSFHSLIPLYQFIDSDTRMLS
jgi:hypothetical protein